MPVYTIQRDPPWIPPPDIGLPTASTLQSRGRGQGQDASVPRSQPSYHPSYHAHPQQQIQDSGPQLRQSRLPLFKHVRSMLHKPPPITTPSDPKWIHYTRDRSDSAQASGNQPSTHVSPYDGAFKSSRKRSPHKDQSPVSVLNDAEITPVEQEQEATAPADRSPVSPVSAPSLAEDESDDDIDQSLLPEPLSPNVQRAPAAPGPRTPPNLPQVKRKPVSRDFSAENYPPQHSRSPSSDLDASPEAMADASANAKSHFSWTTCATSVGPGRASIDAVAGPPTHELSEVSKSRFSWSTVATNVTQRVRSEIPPSSPPPIPSKHSSPPVQSILSRRRPIQRIEKEEWNHHPRAARLEHPSPSDSTTPSSAATLKAVQLPNTLAHTTATASPTTGAAKALPPPPQLTPSNNLNHMETLLAQERDIVLQRHNVERAIRELVKIEKASPLDVPFATVRDAKKRLAEYRGRLDEVRLEERGIGIAIARARRREEQEMGGDGETLWVRRVTG